MSQETPIDYYEILQISVNAEPDTIHRVYRLMAQRYHPDNQETGSEIKFRQIREAYDVLSDPEKRAQYDILHAQRRQARIRVANEGIRAENDFQLEQVVRLSVLEALYAQRRLDPNKPGVFLLDLEELAGTPREHLEFTLWYLAEKGFIKRGDNSRLLITAEGVDYLEENFTLNLQRRRLRAHSESPVPHESVA
jgi:curved DNA-binding protein CbpA